MKPKEFVAKYYPFAKITQTKTGINAIAILAQGALESGWGEVAPGNMIFGVKDTDGINGNEQLITTTEYTRSLKNPMPVHISSIPVVRNGIKMFKHKGQDYFRKYNTPEESFTDHAVFFIKNKRYAKALLVKSDPYKFIDEIAAANYATDPDYAKTLKEVAKMIERLI
jgi:flagellum-specific peptidoglycan hydrolase FlgJ